MTRDDENILLGLIALAALVVAVRGRGPIVEVIPSDEPLRGTVTHADSNWRLDQ